MLSGSPAARGLSSTRGGCRIRGRGVAALPAEAQGCFGPRLSALIAVLAGGYRMSKRNVQELLGDLLGVDIALGTVSKLEARVSEALVASHQEALDQRRRVIDGWSGAFSMRKYERAAVDVLRRVLEDYRPASDEEPAEIAALLELRARLYAVLGRPEHARRDYAEARSYLARAPVDDPTRRGRRQVALMIEEATQAIRVGDDAAARALVDEALRAPQQIAFVEDLVAARAELAALRADPR